MSQAIQELGFYGGTREFIDIETAPLCQVRTKITSLRREVSYPINARSHEEEAQLSRVKRIAATAGQVLGNLISITGTALGVVNLIKVEAITPVYVPFSLTLAGLGITIVSIFGKSKASNNELKEHVLAECARKAEGYYSLDETVLSQLLVSYESCFGNYNFSNLPEGFSSVRDLVILLLGTHDTVREYQDKALKDNCNVREHLNVAVNESKRLRDLILNPYNP